jgi:AraC-like DNA-binding protein
MIIENVHFSTIVGDPMNRLFEPVPFDHRDLIWHYRSRSEHEYKGYYHWHQCCELFFVHEGHGKIVLNRHSYDIKRGMFFFFQPYQLHHMYAEVSPEQPFERSIFYFDPNVIEKQLLAFPKKLALFTTLCQDRATNHAYDLSEHANMLEWIYARYDSHHTDRAGGFEDIVLLILQVLGCLELVMSDTKQPPSSTAGASRYSEKIMRWIEAHHDEEVSLKRIAEETHLSAGYISRLFREETGSNITDYLTARRMQHACRLLETTDLSVELIGNQVGIPNASYFIQLFKREVGTTPYKYRNWDISEEAARRL